MLRFMLIILAVAGAFASQYVHMPIILRVAESISYVFVNVLRLISVPIVFLSILSTFSGFKNPKDARWLIGNTIYNTLFTTAIATIVTLVVYKIILPVKGSIDVPEAGVLSNNSGDGWDMGRYLSFIVPDNFAKVLLENNVVASMLAAFLLGTGSMFVIQEKRDVLHQFFSAVFEMLIQVAGGITKFMPIAVWAFVTVFLSTPERHNFSQGIAKYILCVLTSIGIQALIVLPVFLKVHGIRVIHTIRGAAGALVTAFLTGASVAALPVTMDCVEKNLGISKKLAAFVLPICATINMNACASFILTTVLFVLEMNVHTLSVGEIVLWMFLAVGGAIGNVSMPMGCYFMTMNYLIFMNIPLGVMGLILPTYAFINMFATTLNVWSDICIISVMNKKYGTEK